MGGTKYLWLWLLHSTNISFSSELQATYMISWHLYTYPVNSDSANLTRPLLCDDLLLDLQVDVVFPHDS